MISSSPVRSSLIFHVSRPVKTLIKKFSLVLLFFAAVFGIFISQNDSDFSYKVRTVVVDVSTPVIGVLSAPIVFFDDLGASTKSYFFLHSKNEELKLENQKLKSKLIKLSGIAYENESLKHLLKYTETVNYKYISARVVGNTSGPFYSSVLINAGQQDHVKKGQAVVNEDGLVGRVIEVGKKSSRVMLITDINSNIPAITSRSRERSIMSGNNDNAPRLIYLPSESNTAEGDIVMTSGDGEMYPSGLQIGVVKVGSDGARYVEPFAKWHKLEHLSIIDYSGKYAD